MGGSLITLTAFIWFFSSVCHQMRLKLPFHKKIFITLVAFIWFSPVLTYSLKCITMIHLRFLIIDWMHLWVSPVLTYSLKCITMIHLRFLIIDKNECNIPVLTLKHFVSCYITLIWRVFYCIYTLHHIYLVSH